MNAVVLKLREKGKPKEEIQAFKSTAPGMLNLTRENFITINFKF